MDGGDDTEVAPAPPPPPLEWKFSQVFGERTAGEEVQEGMIFSVLLLLLLLSFLIYSDPRNLGGISSELGFSICFGSSIVE